MLDGATGATKRPMGSTFREGIELLYEFVIDLAVTFLYLPAIVVIERFIKPAFGEPGPPWYAQAILFLIEATLIVSLLGRLVSKVKKLLGEGEEPPPPEPVPADDTATPAKSDAASPVPKSMERKEGDAE